MELGAATERPSVQTLQHCNQANRACAITIRLATRASTSACHFKLLIAPDIFYFRYLLRRYSTNALLLYLGAREYEYIIYISRYLESLFVVDITELHSPPI